MPGWHEATRELQEAGRVRMVGIIQEQHPDRCRLFMQWKKMSWPILVDSLNLLDVSSVPIVLGVDENGVVRKIPRDPRKLESAWLDPVQSSSQVGPRRDLFEGVDAGLVTAHRIVLARDESRIDKAIELYQTAIQKNPSDAPTHFRLGVAYRLRYDSEKRHDDDFQQAVGQWQAALDLNPNQYIWRRRIQQYGPLLDKPYPFYDWIATARAEINARGETPAALRVEPGGTELAGRGSFSPSKSTTEPDPQARITRDDAPLIDMQVTVVPAVVQAGQTARVHVTMRPNGKSKGHWNNEAGQLAFWVNPPDGWEVDQRLLSHPNARTEISEELRVIEFEIRVPKDAPTGPNKWDAYALYYVCRGDDGTCLYRRQTIQATVRVRAE